MNLHRLLQERAAAGRPVRVGLIGAGKFGSMFLNQVLTMPGLEVSTIADLDTERARDACRKVGWDTRCIERTRLLASGSELCTDPEVEVVVEATGSPAAGIAHARAAIAAGRHIVMVNVEADVLAGPLLAEEARRKGVVYSLAYGDQPALTCELVDWARACGFGVAAAGKGTKYLPAYHQVTPDEVWGHYGLTPEEAQAGGMNPQMFNSFLDGTKSAIEMAAIANATGLGVPADGLAFPPCGVDDLPHVLRGREVGGALVRDGMVEVVSCLERDGRPVFRDLRWGVYVVLKAPNEYARTCFKEYGLKTDSSGWYAAMYKPYHLIGLELGISVLSAALRGEPTGQPQGWRGDVVAVAKRDLSADEMLDGEGGYTVWGKLVPAERSLAESAIPIGLAHHVRLLHNIARGEIVRSGDVAVSDTEAARVRREMEQRFAPAPEPAGMPQNNRGRHMEYRRFGRTDLKVSAIGFGCWEIGGTYGQIDESEFQRAVAQAIDNGVTCFDTAEAYGMGISEEALSRALGGRRKDVVIATKFGVGYEEMPNRRDSSRARVLASIDKSLQRLRVDHVDIYLVHWPDPSTPLEETMRALDDVVRQGKARYIGVSNFRLAQIEQAMRLRRVDVVQYAWNMFDRRMQAEIFPYCAAQQIGVMAYGSLAYGILTGSFRAGMQFEESDWRSKGGMLGSINLFRTLFGSEHFPRNVAAGEELKRRATKYGKSLPQFALRWTLSNPVVGTALVGFRTPAEVTENLGALGWEISNVDLAEVDAILDRHGAVTVPPGWLED